eukprot:gene1983-2440_t
MSDYLNFNNINNNSYASLNYNNYNNSSTIQNLTTTPSAFSITTSDPYQTNDRVRVAVIGDTAVGKTSLVHLICNDQVLFRSPSWTMGCTQQVKMHEYHSKDYYIEFIDVGGSSKYKITRPIIYGNQPINGLIVVYDLTNKISLANVKKWIFEVLNKISPSTQTSNWNNNNNQNTSTSSSGNNSKMANIPIIIIGNKSDLYYDHNFIENDKIGKLSLIVSSKNKDSFSSGSSNGDKLELFFNKMISNQKGNKRRNLPMSMKFNSQIFNFPGVFPSSPEDNRNINSNSNNNNSSSSKDLKLQINTMSNNNNTNNSIPSSMNINNNGNSNSIYNYNNDDTTHFEPIPQYTSMPPPSSIPSSQSSSFQSPSPPSSSSSSSNYLQPSSSSLSTPQKLNRARSTSFEQKWYNQQQNFRR